MPYRRCFRVGLWEFCVSMDGLLQHFIDIKLCASFEERIFNGTNQVDLCNLYHLYHRVLFWSREPNVCLYWYWHWYHSYLVAMQEEFVAASWFKLTVLLAWSTWVLASPLLLLLFLLAPLAKANMHGLSRVRIERVGREKKLTRKGKRKIQVFSFAFKIFKRCFNRWAHLFSLLKLTVLAMRRSLNTCLRSTRSFFSHAYQEHLLTCRDLPLSQKLSLSSHFQ